MKRVILLWILAFILTGVFLVWQKMSGPTYEKRFDTELVGTRIKGELLRTHSINADMPVTIHVPDDAVSATVIWRRFPTDDPWTKLPMVRDGEVLRSLIPRQGMAGKVEYHVELTKDGQKVEVPMGEAAVARFKGDVPNTILMLHIFAIVMAFLFSTGAGFEALTNGSALKVLSRITLGFIVVGGLILGPIVQKHAFDAYWTGWPLGEDLTDNKLAVGALLWLIAVIRSRNAGPGNPAGKWWAVAAMLVIFVIFSIPHSIHGSTLDYESGEHIQVMVETVGRLFG
ncbi:MAG: hypothetical protein KAH56_07325 [Candidatus Krumholzibacteria bacterium]|nr:hypothetical protein [Candidatus Krumholzibacteria bacterium]